jgi:hypothetical protein
MDLEVLIVEDFDFCCDFVGGFDLMEINWELRFECENDGR